MKKILYILLILLFATAGKLNAKEYSLEEAIKESLQNSWVVKSKELSVESAYQKMKESRSPLFPQLKGLVNASYLIGVPEIKIEDKGIKLNKEFSGNVKLNTGYIIYDGGLIKSTADQAFLNWENEKLSLTLLNQKIILDTISKFLNVLRSKQLVVVAEKRLASFVEQYKVTKSLFEAGVAPRADLLQSEAQVANGEIELEQAKGNEAISVSTLAEQLGIDLEENVEVKDELIFTPLNLDYNDALEIAYSNRIELRNIDKLEKIASDGITIAKSGNKPQIALNIDYNVYSNNIFVKNNSAQTTLALTLPLFDGFLTKSKTKEAEAVYKEITCERENLKRQIALQVKASLIQVNTSYVKYNKSQQAVASAEESLRVAKIRYKSGIASFIEISQTEAILQSAQTSQVNNLYDYYQALANLSFTLGIIEQGKFPENLFSLRKETRK